MISGYRNSGKNYVADELQKQLESLGYSVAQMAFADPLKQALSKTLSISIDQLNLYKNNPNDYIATVHTQCTTVRTMLQNLGTEMKNQFGEEIFVDAVRRKLIVTSEDFAIVTDARYDIEYNLGLPTTNLRVIGYKPNDTHSSERLPTVEQHFTIDNTSKSMLQQPVAAVIKKLLDD